MFGKIIAFRVYKNTDVRTTNRFCQKFYGQDTTSHGGRYNYHKHGLMEDIPHVRLIRGVIIVSEKDAEKVMGFLKDYKAEFHVRDVVLTHKDLEKLQK